MRPLSNTHTPSVLRAYPTNMTERRSAWKGGLFRRRYFQVGKFCSHCLNFLDDLLHGSHLCSKCLLVIVVRHRLLDGRRRSRWSLDEIHSVIQDFSFETVVFVKLSFPPVNRRWRN